MVVPSKNDTYLFCANIFLAKDEPQCVNETCLDEVLMVCNSQESFSFQYGAILPFNAYRNSTASA